MKPLTSALGSLLLIALVVFIIVIVDPFSTPVPPPPPGPATPTPITPTSEPAPNSILVTLVSSSTKRDWLDQVVERFNALRKRVASGEIIRVEVSHTRSGSSMNDILDGKSKPVAWSPGDQSWADLMNKKWRRRENRPLISQACPSTVYAPIGFAMWRPMAEALGWPDMPIGWDTIVELAADPEGWSTYGHDEWGEFRFGHSHPAYSNTGMLSMTSFVHGIVGTYSSLDGDQVYQPAVEEAMRSLEQNTRKYGAGSTALFDLMVKQGPSYVHAIAASEETTIRYNLSHGDELRFPLAFIFPSGGTIWAGHPYCILDNADWVSSEESEAAAIFGDYLLAPEQQALAIDNRLRPTDSSIALHAPISLDNGTDPRVDVSNAILLPSPNAVVSAAVIDLFMITKRKATVIIVLDVSGSMGGDKIKTATSATAEFLTRLDPDDEVAVLTFSEHVVTLSEPDSVHNVVEGLSPRVRSLTAGGNTPLHAAVCRATALAGELQAEDEAQGESRLYGIVLLSDGEDTTGRPTETQMFTTCLPATAEVDGFKIFPIAFGDEANKSLLSRMALATGGRLFSADPDSISAVYFSISAEQ
jgi:Ca-activated chloride channel family protein